MESFKNSNASTPIGEEPSERGNLNFDNFRTIVVNIGFQI